jgi:hypothetical protein
MPNPIKYSTSGQSQALKIGNTWLGTGDVAKGPTDVTGYWSSIDPPTGGYTVNLGGGDYPATFCPADDAELISLTNRIAGTSYTTAAQCLAYYAAQSDKNCLNITYPPIVTSGLILSLDAGFTPSYPKAGTTWYDLGGNGYNSNLVNGPAYSISGAGSVAFDGADDSSSITCNFTNLNGLTVNIFYYSNVNSNTALTRGSDNAYIVHFRGAGFYLIDSAGTVSDYLGWNPLPTGLNWRMLTATWDGSTMRLYQNGVKQTGERSFTGTGILRTFTSIALGYNFNLSQPSTNGNISNYQLYNRALSNSEIIQNYQAMFPRFLGANIVTKDLNLYLDPGYSGSYPGSGTSWNNVSGYGGSATLVNSPSYNSINGGAFLLASTSYFTFSGVTTGTSFSAFLWFYYDGQTEFSFRGHRTFFATSTFRYQWDDTSTIAGYGPFLNFNAASGGSILLWSNLSLTPATLYNNWHYVGITSDGTTIRNYFDGVQIGTNITLTRPFSLEGNLRIAYNAVSGIGSADPFYEVGGDNFIGPFSVYNRGLTSQEVLQNFNAQKGRFGL